MEKVIFFLTALAVTMTIQSCTVSSPTQANKPFAARYVLDIRCRISIYVEIYVPCEISICLCCEVPLITKIFFVDCSSKISLETVICILKYQTTQMVPFSFGNPIYGLRKVKEYIKKSNISFSWKLRREILKRRKKLKGMRLQ